MKTIIIAVTKNRTINEIENLPTRIQDIAENKLQEAVTKIPHIRRNLKFHYIGSIQSNKISKIIDLFNCIQSVSSLKILNKIDEISKK